MQFFVCLDLLKMYISCPSWSAKWHLSWIALGIGHTDMLSSGKALRWHISTRCWKISGCIWLVTLEPQSHKAKAWTDTCFSLPGGSHVLLLRSTFKLQHTLFWELRSHFPTCSTARVSQFNCYINYGVIRALSWWSLNLVLSSSILLHKDFWKIYFLIIGFVWDTFQNLEIWSFSYLSSSVVKQQTQIYSGIEQHSQETWRRDRINISLYV